jgi:hypothetical protein
MWATTFFLFFSRIFECTMLSYSSEHASSISLLMCTENSYSTQGKYNKEFSSSLRGKERAFREEYKKAIFC